LNCAYPSPVPSHMALPPPAKPTPLSVALDDGNHPRLSHGSATYSDDEPPESAMDSSAPLIVDHGDEGDEEGDERDVDERPSALDFFSDSDDSDDLDDSLSPLYHINGKLSIPPLSPFTVFIYLLSPYLKLGALLLPSYQLPLKYGLSSLLVCAVLALVARHLLYLIARYLRKADLEDVFSNTFVSAKKRGRRIEKRRELFRLSVKVGTATLRVFLTVVYLQGRLRLRGLMQLPTNLVNRMCASRASTFLFSACSATGFNEIRTGFDSHTTRIGAFVSWFAGISARHQHHISVHIHVSTLAVVYSTLACARCARCRP
jgi:hypothetical protein